MALALPFILGADGGHRKRPRDPIQRGAHVPPHKALRGCPAILLPSHVAGGPPDGHGDGRGADGEAPGQAAGSADGGADGDDHEGRDG